MEFIDHFNIYNLYIYINMNENYYYTDLSNLDTSYQQQLLNKISNGENISNIPARYKSSNKEENIYSVYDTQLILNQEGISNEIFNPETNNFFLVQSYFL